MNPVDIVIASNNSHKVAEIKGHLPDWFRVHPASEFEIESPIESGTTFVENAIIKARHASTISGLPALADDSGLEVTGLSGMPGIHSARYAGDSATDEDNNNKLLVELEGVKNRTARFVCVIVYLQHAADPLPTIATGIWEGEILLSPGGQGGFGYDPLFYVPAQGTSVAELAAETKHQLSHRGQALRQLRTLLDGA